VYGSDAVAGVVNFVTRRGFDGFEANAQAVWRQLPTYSGGFLGGKTWEGGSALLSYSYSYFGNLSQGKDRTPWRIISAGGYNLETSPALRPRFNAEHDQHLHLSLHRYADLERAVQRTCDSSRYSDLLRRRSATA